MIIAITGFIGAGKTTVSEVFRRHGFRVINVDQLGHELTGNPEICEKLKAEFGMSIMGRDFQVDRDRLSGLVFNDPEKLMTLNRIIHPYLKQTIKQRIRRSSEDIVLDVALFRELNLDDVVEKVILVQADVAKIYDRLASRYTKKEIINIMNNQHMISKADFIIENNGTIEDLDRRVHVIIRKLGL